MSEDVMQRLEQIAAILRAAGQFDIADALERGEDIEPMLRRAMRLARRGRKQS